jgi:hypothetical protein
MRGLDPRIHHFLESTAEKTQAALRRRMDPRVKPAGDTCDRA